MKIEDRKLKVQCVCGRSSFKQIFSLIIDNNSFELLQCNKCCLVIASPDISSKVLFNKYYSSYRSEIYGKRFSSPLDKLMKMWRKIRGRKMFYLSPSGSVLDIGCGQATELQYLASKGISVCGVELSKKMAHAIQQMTGLQILHGHLKKLKLKKKSFSLITFFHSLEHIPEAHHYLEMSSKLLKNKGYLLISVPNLASWEAKIFNKYWFHLDLPRHRYHFTKNYIVNYLTKLNFSLVSTNYIAPEYDFYSFIQSSLNRIFPNNQYLLYKILLKEETNSSSDYIKVIPQTPFIVLLTLLSLFIVPMFWITKQSGTVEMLFRKIHK